MTTFPSPPAYLFIDYDRVRALLGASRNPFGAAVRHFGADDNGFTAFAFDPDSDLPVYEGKYVEHPDHGEIGVFWPRDAAKRDHGYWCMTTRLIPT